MEDISRIAGNVELLEEGIWASKARMDVSYPRDGNASCFILEDRSFWFKHRNDCIIEIVKRFPPSGAIFDIGGGNGYVSMGLKNSGFDTVLVEPGIEGAHNAKARGISAIICSTLEDAGFYEGAMPAAGIFDVLEHIEDDVEFLKIIRSFLAPGGKLYITVPAHDLLWSAEDDHAGHYRRYSLKELTRKLETAGYQVDHATYFFSILILPIFLFRSVPSRLGYRKSTFEANRREHEPNARMTGFLLACLKYELWRIKTGKIGLGASCLIVARADNWRHKEQKGNIANELIGSNIIYLILTILFQALAAVFAKYASMSIENFTVISILSSAFYLLSIACLALQAVIWQQALKHYDLSFAYPFVSLVNFVILGLSIVLFKEGFSLANVIGLLLISIGLYFLSKGGTRA